MSNLLLEERPLVIIPSLAVEIGLEEAIVLQQIHYWLVLNRQAKRNFFDGKFWTYNTPEKWQQENFPFWTVKKVRTTLNSLRSMGLLIVGNYNKMKADRTLWYTINYDRFELICQKVTNGLPKKDTPIPETTTDIPSNSEKNRKKGYVTTSNGITAILQAPRGKTVSMEDINQSAEEIQKLVELGLINYQAQYCLN